MATNISRIRGYYYDKRRKRYFRIIETNDTDSCNDQYSRNTLREKQKVSIKEKHAEMKKNAIYRSNQIAEAKRKQVLSMKREIIITDVNGLCRYLLMDPRAPSREDISTFMKYKDFAGFAPSSYLLAFQQKIFLQKMHSHYLTLPIRGTQKLMGFYMTNNCLFSLSDALPDLFFEKLNTPLTTQIRHKLINSRRYAVQNVNIRTIRGDHHNELGCIRPSLIENNLQFLEVELEHINDSISLLQTLGLNIIRIIFDRIRGPLVVYHKLATKDYYAAHIPNFDIPKTESLVLFQESFNRIFPFYFEGESLIAYSTERNGTYFLQLRGDTDDFRHILIEIDSSPVALCQSKDYTYVAFQDGRVNIYRTEGIVKNYVFTLCTIETNTVICQMEIISNAGNSYLLVSGLNSFLTLYKIDVSQRSVSVTKFVTYSGYSNTFDYSRNFKMIEDSPFFIISSRPSTAEKPILLLYYLFLGQPLHWINPSINKPECMNISMNLSFDFIQGNLFVLNSEEHALQIYG